MSCRDIKARCLLSTPDSAPQDPCKRCVRLGLQCVYTPKRRPTRYTKFGGVTYARTGDGQSLSGSPAAATTLAVNTSNNTASNNTGNPVDTYSSFSSVIDPSLAAKYGQTSHSNNTRPASSGIWSAYGNLSTGFGVAGEYDTSATRTSIQAPGMDGVEELGGKREEDTPVAMHYSRRTTDYGMSGTGSHTPPAITLNLLSESQKSSSTSNLGQPRTLVDLSHRAFDDNGSTPARAATGMDLVSDLSNMRSSASGSVLPTGGSDAAYRLPLPAFGYNSTTSKEVAGRSDVDGLSYDRYYDAPSGEFTDASSSRNRDRKAELTSNSTSSDSVNQYRPPSLSMIVHRPSDGSRGYPADFSPPMSGAFRASKRRRTGSPPHTATSDKMQTTSAGFAPEDSSREVIAAGKYDAVRYDREEAEENRGGMDWMSLVMRKRGGFEGTECPIALGLVSEDEVRFLFDQ